jgi:hypothetical protein
MGPQLPLVGMEKETLRLISAFSVGDSLLLLGPQGCGKTRLTKEVLSGCGRVLYIPWAPTLHDLLIAMTRALIAARHSQFVEHAKPGADPELWLKTQTSIHLKGLLWTTMETSPVPIMLDGVMGAGFPTTVSYSESTIRRAWPFSPPRGTFRLWEH